MGRRLLRLLYHIFMALSAAAFLTGICILFARTWRPHLYNLLSRTWLNFLHYLGTTGAGFITPILVALGTVVGTLAVIGYLHGRQAMLKHWWENAAITAVVTIAVLLIVYGPIFGNELTETVYQDHENFVHANGMLRQDNTILAAQRVPVNKPPAQSSPPQKPSMSVLDPRSTARFMIEYQKQIEKSQSPLKKDLFDLSKRLMRFAAEREKVQPQRPPGLHGPPQRFRNSPEWQKYQADQTQFVTESRDQFTKKFESRLASVVSQLKDQEIDVDGVCPLCAAPTMRLTQMLFDNAEHECSYSLTTWSDADLL